MADSINRILDKEGKEVVSAYKKRKGLVMLRQTGNLIFVSGHGPEDQVTRKPLFTGRIGENGDIPFDEGYRAARQCAIIHLAALRDHLGDLDKIKRTVRVFGLVNCAEGFNDVEGVMDGFSDTLADVLQERAFHARTVMGTHNLPNGNIPVEVEMIVEI